MGGGGLNNYQISRQIDITPIITSDKFISIFRDSDYSVFDDWNEVNNNITNKYTYNIGYDFDASFKKEIYNSFINDYKTQLDNGTKITLNALCAYITDATANLGSDFNLESVTSKDELLKKPIGGRFASGTSYMTSYENFATKIGLDSSIFRKLFTYASYKGCNTVKVSTDTTWSRFRGYDRCLFCLFNAFKFLGYDFSKCFKVVLIPWAEVNITTNASLGTLLFAQYLN